MLQNSKSDYWKSRIDSYLESAQDNLLYVGLVFVFFAVLAGGWLWYRSAAIKKEQAAHTILADCLSQYEQAAQGKAQWSDVVTMTQAGYDKFSNTKTAPYILAVQIDALLAQDKKQEALEKLNTTVSQMGKNSPVYSLFKLKEALLKLDMPDLEESGVQELQQLAQTKENNFADAAQYYLGLYYQSKDQQEKALEVWKPLIALNDNVSDTIARSPWATFAQSKVNGLA